MEGDPIRRGWIQFEGSQITAIQAGDPPAGAEDLGDVAMLPGLINAHTHLDLSDCDSPIGEPGVSMSSWVMEVIQARIHLDRNPAAAVTKGWLESVRAGVRLVGDIATPPVNYPTTDWVTNSPIECVSFAEVLGLDDSRFADRYGAMETHHQETTAPNIAAGISPHAPYSISREAINRCVRWSNVNQSNLAIHLAESPEERELLVQGTGPLREELEAMGLPMKEHFPWGDQAFVELIDEISTCHRGLVIHANDLRDHEIEKLAQHENLSVVFCPRTHAFFQFHRHPVDQMLRANIRVALGTDSRASNPDLDLWSEVRYMLNHRQEIPPVEVLKMATVNGADALGRTDLGRLKVGTAPGWVTVPTTASSSGQLYRDLANHPVGRCG